MYKKNYTILQSHIQCKISLGIDCAHPEETPISRLAANRGFVILCPDKTCTKMAHSTTSTKRVAFVRP